jgi:hypothetical protein
LLGFAQILRVPVFCWDRCVERSEEIAKRHGDGMGCDLSPFWGGVETSCAHERRRNTSGKEGCVLATDASSRGYEWILYLLEKKGNRDCGVWAAAHDSLAFAFRFEVTDERHIFLKELSSACAALSWAHATGYRRVRLVVDNSAFALKSGMTTSDAGKRLIDGHRSVLEEALLDVVLVISQDDQDDCSSRGSAEGLLERSANMNKSLTRTGGSRGVADASLCSSADEQGWGTLLRDNWTRPVSDASGQRRIAGGKENGRASPLFPGRVNTYSRGKKGKDHTVTVRAFLDLELSSYVVSLQ